MGNAIVCLCNAGMMMNKYYSSQCKLIFWEGQTRVLTGKHVAGEIMFEFPEMMVCHADSFFIGKPVPVLDIQDILVPGQSYFVLPIDCFFSTCNNNSSSSSVLSASSLAALGSKSNSPNSNNPKSPINYFGNDKQKQQPFEYIKGQNGKLMIKVAPDFIIRLITKPAGPTVDDQDDGPALCSTPELRKHYDQLVGTTIWSPKLETITEHNNIRFSPSKFLGLQKSK